MILLNNDERKAIFMLLFLLSGFLLGDLLGIYISLFLATLVLTYSDSIEFQLLNKQLKNEK